MTTTFPVRAIRDAVLLAFAALPLSACTTVSAEPVTPTVSTPAVRASAPRLVVAITVDQFSADLFQQYRRRFAGGLARLEDGVVFPSGYQSHASTETCPGHSTILTGMRPARTGIIANSWFDVRLGRKNKKLNCLEDPAQVPQGDEQYVVTTSTLLVPTLGERMKAANPASRNVAVSGKDRGAVMMGGSNTDTIVWWRERAFETVRGRTLDPAASEENARVAGDIAAGLPDYALPTWCSSLVEPVAAGTLTVGTGRLSLPAGDARAYRYTPHLDRSTLDIALRLVDAQQLGRNAAPDLLSVSLSATDYIGHAYGNGGPEMCIQMHELDRALGDFFAALDARGIDYAVVLTADHGGFDMVERQKLRAYPQAERPAKELLGGPLGDAVKARLGLTLTGPLLYSDAASGDYYISAEIPAMQHPAVIGAVRELLAGDETVAAIYSAAELQAAPMPGGSPDNWTLLDRAKASFYPGRSGDFVILMRRGVTISPTPGPGYVASHGTPWDYDRRVPILFWRNGIEGFEQPNPVETVDIAPTLAAWIGLKIPAGTFDGRCLDLDAGAGDTCGAP